MRFGLFQFRSPLLSESFVYFLFLQVIRWFSSLGSPHTPMDSVYDSTTLLVLSFLIRISTGQRSFATHRSFSQLVTSFFGAMYQGILLYALCSLFFSSHPLLNCFRNPFSRCSVELINHSFVIAFLYFDLITFKLSRLYYLLCSCQSSKFKHPLNFACNISQAYL